MPPRTAPPSLATSVSAEASSGPEQGLQTKPRAPPSSEGAAERAAVQPRRRRVGARGDRQHPFREAPVQLRHQHDQAEGDQQPGAEYAHAVRVDAQRRSEGAENDADQRERRPTGAHGQRRQPVGLHGAADDERQDGEDAGRQGGQAAGEQAETEMGQWNGGHGGA